VAREPLCLRRRRRHRATLLAHLREALAAQRRPGRRERHTKQTCALLTSLRFRRYLRQTRRGLPRLDRTRPLFHWRPHRISAHVSLYVLALLLERIAETRVGDTWRNILAQLDTIKVVEYERAEARVHQTTEVSRGVADLLQRLQVPLPPKLHHVAATAPASSHDPSPSDCRNSLIHKNVVCLDPDPAR
jgi:hypothetical protein